MSERFYIVTGDRNWHVYDIAMKLLNSMIAKGGNTFTILHGDCAGVDKSFGEACETLGINQIVFPANWNGVTRPEANVRHKDGKANMINAGPVRNSLMLRTAQALGGPHGCFAFHKRLVASKGTRDMVEKCLRAGVPVWLVDGKDSEPRKIERAE